MGSRRKPAARLDPTVELWWECGIGSARIFVVAEGPVEARRKAEAELRDLGAVAGGPPDLYESFTRMREFAKRGR